MIDVLRTELTTDPKTRGYAGMTDEEAADDLNTEYRTRNRTSMTGSEVLQSIDQTRLAGLSAADKERVWQVLHLGQLDPFGVEADILINVFGPGSDTIVALQVARKENVSRAVELGLGSVREGTVAQARVS